MSLRRIVVFCAFATIGVLFGQSDKRETGTVRLGNSQDEGAIRSMLAEDGETNWNNHRMAESVTSEKVIDDAIFINTTGGMIKGRETFAQVISRLHAPGGPLSDNTRRQQVEELRFIRPDVVVAVVKYFDTKQAGVPVAGHDTRALIVLSKENGHWKVNALENTLIQPTPMGRP